MEFVCAWLTSSLILSSWGGADLSALIVPTAAACPNPEYVCAWLTLSKKDSSCGADLPAIIVSAAADAGLRRHTTNRTTSHSFESFEEHDPSPSQSAALASALLRT